MIENELQANTLLKSRVIKAKREDVYRAWTEPEFLAQWWWPARFQTTYEIDLREGGAWRFYTPEMADRGVMGVHGVFKEVVPNERLVYTWNWEMEGEYEAVVTVEFLDRDDATEVVVTVVGLRDAVDRDANAQGWGDCLDRLAARAAEGKLLDGANAS